MQVVRVWDLQKQKHISDIVIHPTNSCYGIAASIYDEAGYYRIFELKGRDAKKPFFITVNSYEEISGVGELDSRIGDLQEKYPQTVFTFILKRSSDLPSYINPHLDTVGVQIARGPLGGVCDYFNAPIFGTSANTSGENPIYTPEEIISVFGKYDDILFLDGGELQYNPPSTIVDLTQEPLKILRGTL